MPYAITMKHIEIHVMRNSEDSELAQLAGLIELEDEEHCDYCSELVAFNGSGGFYPCAVVLDEDTVFLLCVGCLVPILGEPYTEN
jgi:hypothetical protein